MMLKILNSLAMMKISLSINWLSTLRLLLNQMTLALTCWQLNARFHSNFVSQSSTIFEQIKRIWAKTTSWQIRFFVRDLSDYHLSKQREQLREKKIKLLREKLIFKSKNLDCLYCAKWKLECNRVLDIACKTCSKKKNECVLILCLFRWIFCQFKQIKNQVDFEELKMKI